MTRHDCAKHPEPAYVCSKICGCDCYGCLRERSDYNRRRARLQAYGRWRPYADATRAREHVRWLQSQGMGWKTVAARAGLASSTVWKLLYGDPARGQTPSRRIRPATGAAIMRVQPTLDDLADGARVDASDTHARLRALRDAGWTWRALGDRVGVHGSNLCGVLRRSEVTVRIARAVRDLYASELAPPPEARAQPSGRRAAKLRREVAA